MPYEQDVLSKSPQLRWSAVQTISGQRWRCDAGKICQAAASVPVEAQ